MATVVLAEDTVLGRQVALKRMIATGDAEGLLRLRREALVGASISHPNLVAVYDVITLEEGEHVIVMEYVRGETVRDALEREGRLAPRVALPILEGVAAALDAIHGQGIVHRDVKPANVLLGINGTVKLADLGIASVPDRTEITTAGAVLGSFRYMAPEQLEDSPATAAMDVYGLSAVAFEVLSGRQARPEPNPVALAYAISSQPPPDLREAWPEAPPAAAELLRRGMAHHPAKRPRSAGELIRRLRATLEPPAPRRAPAVLGRASGVPGGAAAALGGAAAALGGAAASRGRGAAAPGGASAPSSSRGRGAAAASSSRLRPPPGGANDQAEVGREQRHPSHLEPAGRRGPSRRVLAGLLALAAVAVIAAAALAGGGSSPTSRRAGAAGAAGAQTSSSAGRSRSSAGSAGTPSTPAATQPSTRSTPAAGSSSASSATPATHSTGASAQSGTSAAGARSGAPVSAVESFYELAAAHRYSQAWALADPTFRAQLAGYASFQAGQSGDRVIRFNSARVVDQSGDSATVAINTTSVRNDGTKHCSGTVDLRRSAAAGGWLLHVIHINCT